MLNLRQVRAIADWWPGYPYLPDMEVVQTGVRFRCVASHTSSSDFSTDVQGGGNFCTSDAGAV